MNPQRLHSIDLLRGVAVVLMIFYHFFFDLVYFYQKQISGSEFLVFIGPEIIGGLFLFTSGLSYSLSFHKPVSTSKIKKILFLFLISFLITLFTFFYFKDQLILFGILHCIAASSLLGLFLKKRTPSFILSLSIFILFMGFYFMRKLEFSYFLIPFLNLKSSAHFVMLDHFPLFPYFGEYLLGLWFGLKFFSFQVKKSEQTDTFLKFNFLQKKLVFLGKHSLLIYLIHQPLLLALLSILNQLNFI